MKRRAATVIAAMRARIELTFNSLTLVLAGASTVQAAGQSKAAGLPNCNDKGAITPCFEMIWADGVQVKMTFVNLNPKPSNAPTEKFYVMAPQTDPAHAQGHVPFLHDHLIGDVSPRHEDRNGRVRYHGFLVLCSDQGMTSGGCLPTKTSIPGLGDVLLAKTVNGQPLTTADPIESPANSGLLTLFDTGGVFIATIKSRQEDR